MKPVCAIVAYLAMLAIVYFITQTSSSTSVHGVAGKKPLV